MTNATSGLNINFAAIAGKDVTAPQGAAEATLARIDPSKPLEVFSCREGLSEAELSDIRAYAVELLKGFKADRRELSNFGNGSMDALNATVSLILKEQGNLRIPEVERITKEMAKSVADFRRKYRDDDPRLLEAMNKFWDSITGIFQNGQRFFRELQIDSQTAVKRLDGVAGKLIDNKAVLDRNVILCDELYEKNEIGLSNLIGVIAFMEQVLEDLGAETKALKAEVDAMPADKSTDRRKKEEQLNIYVEMLEELDSRRIEFISRLFVAWATAPQLRNLRKVSNSLSQRLNLLVVLTIPTMKLTIAQWGMQLQAEKAGEAGALVARANNDALTEYAASSSQVIPALALQAQTPTVEPATILALADSVVAQNEGLVHAVEEGQRLRAELGSTVVASMRVINESNAKTQAEIIELVTVAKKPLELEAAPEVPESVVEYAKQLEAA